jgi:hypothetical protein
LAIQAILAGVVTLNPSTYTVTGSSIIVSPAIAQGVKTTVIFTTTRYSDDDISGYLGDAAQAVDGTLKYGLVIDTVGLTVDDGSDPSSGQALYQLNNSAGNIRPEIEQLIVYGAGLGVYADKANTAADNAIKIKDGDTSIDTSATAGASEAAIKRLVAQYKCSMQKVLSEGFVGASIDMQQIPCCFGFSKWLSLYW